MEDKMLPLLLFFFLPALAAGSEGVPEELTPAAGSDQVRYVLSASLDSDPAISRCGDMDVKKWKVEVEHFLPKRKLTGQSNPTTSNFFDADSGVLLAPVSGVYFVSSTVRVKGDTYASVTLRVNGKAVSGFGSGKDIGGKPGSSYASSDIVVLNQGDRLTLHQVSGSDDSCLYEPATDWGFNNLNVFLVFATDPDPYF